MTYQEYIEKTVAKFNVSSDEVELILVNQVSLIPDPSATVDPIVAKKALCIEFGNIIPMANISEGGYSITWNMEALKLWYNATCQQVGIVPVAANQIRNKSNLW